MDDKDEIEHRLNKLKLLALSDDWKSREEAGFALRDLMEGRFEEVFALTVDWVTHPSDRVRRAACLACMQRKAYTDIPKLKKVLDRLSVLMKDDSIYVRKCCGPFVVGYLGYTYPVTTLPWLAEKARDEDINVRANTAKAFSQALGGRHPTEGIDILKILGVDDRHRVRSAVLSALRNIVRRKAISENDVERHFPSLYGHVLG